MADEDPKIHERGMKRWTRADAELHAGGGYAAESEAAQMAAALGIEERILAQPIGTLSGGQRRRVELARILFSGAEIMLLDEPTNHLDADSIVWLRDFLKAHRGGFVVISHDNALLEATVNKVFHLDANRAVIDVYNMGWKNYLTQREDDEKRRKRERANAENKAKALTDQANKMRAKATKAQAAQSMLKRAEKMMAGIEGERAADKVARIAFPDPAPCGKTPLTARGAVEVLRLARGLHRRRPRDRPGQPGRHPRPQRRRQDDDAAHPGRRRPARHRRGRAGLRAQDRLLRPGARDPRRRPHRAGEHAVAPRPSSPTPRPAACSGRSSSPATTPTSRPACCPAARRPGSRWRPSSSPAPTCCCSTSPPTTSTPPPARRCSHAIRSYDGRDHPRHPRRGRGARARPRPGAAPARRRRGPVERGLRRPGRRLA